LGALIGENNHSGQCSPRLFSLPPYSPELNADKLVWNDVKNIMGRTSVHSYAALT
jgi:transposase